MLADLVWIAGDPSSNDLDCWAIVNRDPPVFRNGAPLLSPAR
jgi:hypothetical protein